MGVLSLENVSTRSMEIFLNVTYLTLGFVVGLFVYAQMLLPLVYGAPRAIWLYARGEIRFMGVIAQFITPAIWVIILAVLGFLIQIFYPPLNSFFVSNVPFNIGGLLSIAVLLINFLSKKGRADMRSDFDASTYQKYKKTGVKAVDSDMPLTYRVPQERDEFYEKVKSFVKERAQISASDLKRQFDISFVRSCTLLDMLEEDGLIGEGEVTDMRKVILR